MLAEILAEVGAVHLVLLWLGVMAAAILRSFTGFGFGLAAVPVFSLFMAPTQAVVLSSSLTFTISLLTLKTYWGGYPLKPMLPMLAMAWLGTVLGVLLLGSLSVPQFQLLIGIAVIAACLALSRYHPRKRSPGLAVNGITGLASGVLNGAFAIPGPPVIIYAMATETEPARSRSLLMTFFLFSAFLALLSYAAAGFVTPRSPWMFALAFPAMYVGDKLGYYLFRRFGTGLYRRIALVVLLAIGLAITVKSLL
jgi:uncharacterized membrane protein YfcA